MINMTHRKTKINHREIIALVGRNFEEVQTPPWGLQSVSGCNVVQHPSNRNIMLTSVSCEGCSPIPWPERCSWRSSHREGTWGQRLTPFAAAWPPGLWTDPECHTSYKESDLKKFEIRMWKLYSIKQMVYISKCPTIKRVWEKILTISYSLL